MSILVLAICLSAMDEPSVQPQPPGGSADPKATDPKATDPKATEPKKRLRPKKEVDLLDPFTPAEKKTSSDDAPTPEDDRPIPKPTDDKPASDLDEMLQRELGEDLDAKEVEDEDPISKIAGRMRESEERLARADDETKTIEIQEQIVRDLAQFLDDSQKQNPNQQQKQMRKRQSKKKPLNEEQMAELARQRARQRQQMMQNQQGEPAERNGPPRSARERLSPQPEEKAVWGHLSEMLRSEMSQYAKENFLAKYREMIERYYTDISRKSREKGD